MKESLTDAFFTEKLNRPVRVSKVSPAPGGSINNCFLVELADDQSLFIKTHRNNIMPGMYETEFSALQLLGQSSTINVPKGLYVDEQWLILEDFHEGVPALDWQEQMGRGLALLHSQSRRQQFGFDCDNYLGTTPQINSWQDDWLDFWREQRLEYQLKLFSTRVDVENALLKAGSRLLLKLDTILAGQKEPAVLLHGDLWSGNAAANNKGEPVIFDPASYYGHREAEFGMMRLFGGFSAACEAAYQEIWPFQPDYDRRIAVYRLYHQLNHLNLFGGSYYDDCLSTLQKLF